MVTRTWNGGTGDITSPNNWTPAGAPQPGDVARISTGMATGESQTIGYGISLGGEDPGNRPVVQLTNSTIGPQGYVQSSTSFAPGVGVEFGRLIAQGTTTVQGSLFGGNQSISTPGQLRVDIADAPVTNGMGGSPGVLINDGLIEANGVGAQMLGDGGVDIEAASPDAQLVNDGTIQTFGGITLNAPVTGTGQINVENVGIISEGDLLVGSSVSQGQTVNLIGDGNEVVLFQPAQFQGLITGFDNPTDDIFLPNTPAVTSYNFSNGVLTLQNGTDTAAALRFSGSYQTSDFTVKSQNGGTTITTTAVPPTVGAGQGTSPGSGFNLAAEIQQLLGSLQTIEDLVVSILRSASAAFGGTNFESASLQTNNPMCGSMPAVQAGQQTNSLVPHFGS